MNDPQNNREMLRAMGCFAKLEMKTDATGAGESQGAAQSTLRSLPRSRREAAGFRSFPLVPTVSRLPTTVENPSLSVISMPGPPASSPRFTLRLPAEPPMLKLEPPAEESTHNVEISLPAGFLRRKNDPVGRATKVAWAVPDSSKRSIPGVPFSIERLALICLS